LDLVHTKEALEEFMSTKGETAIKKRQEHHSKTGGGIGG
jgi:hypothetical protein